MPLVACGDTVCAADGVGASSFCFSVSVPLWQTLFAAIHELPHGIPFLQLGAAATSP